MKNQKTKFTAQENALLNRLFVPDATENFNGITIRNEEIALLDFFYGANAMKDYEKAKLAIGMLYKCNSKIVDKIFQY